MVASFAMSDAHLGRRVLRLGVMPIHTACQRSPAQVGISGAICGQATNAVEPAKIAGFAIMKPARRIKFLRFANRSSRGFSMHITAAHIQPIVALIAGVLILIMPRFLNLVVAIYLIFIGLSGLGVFKMLHF
jgi:hypothetical protein